MPTVTPYAGVPPQGMMYAGGPGGDPSGGLLGSPSNYSYPLTGGLMGAMSQPGAMQSITDALRVPSSYNGPDYTQTALQLAGNPHAGPYAGNLGAVPPGTSTGSAGSASSGSLLSQVAGGLLGKSGGNGSSSNLLGGNNSSGGLLGKLFNNGSSSSASAGTSAPVVSDGTGSFAPGTATVTDGAGGTTSTFGDGLGTTTTFGDGGSAAAGTSTYFGDAAGVGAGATATGGAALTPVGVDAATAAPTITGLGADAGAAGAADAGAGGAGATAGASVGLGAGLGALGALYALWGFDQSQGQYTPADQYAALANTASQTQAQSQQLQQAIASGKAVPNGRGGYTINGVDASIYYPLAGASAAQIAAANQPLAQNFLANNGTLWAPDVNGVSGVGRSNVGNHSNSRA